MASISTVLYTSKVLKNGESPIRLRIIKDRKIKYFSLGHNSLPEHWDAERQLPKKKHPNATELTILIEKHVTQARKLVIDLEISRGDFSIDEFVQKFQRLSKKTTVFSFVDEVIEAMLKENRVGNSDVYKSLKWVLSRYRNGRDFLFIDVDQSFLNGLELDLRQRGLKETSMSNYFRTFRSLFSKAIAEGYHNAENDPFKEFKVSKFSIKTKKRAISKEKVKEIESLDLEKIPRLNFAKDMFLFSYYSSGMNIIDIARLDSSNLNKGKVYYIRSKTKQTMEGTLFPICVEIIKKYSEYRTDNYLFPILDSNVHLSEVSIKNRVKKVTKQINDGLKEIAPMIDLAPESLTTYVARHSFATSLKRGNYQLEKISELMGHESTKTTRIYLDSFDVQELHEEIAGLL